MPKCSNVWFYMLIRFFHEEIREGKKIILYDTLTEPVLRIRIRNPGYGAFFTPGSGMGNVRIRDRFSESLVNTFLG
jgi:hypothetical protein